MPVPSKRKFHFLVYLALLSILGFLATDMYLPAFDTMRTDFQTTKVNISASLSLFLGAFGVAQLIWGPITDKFGKPSSIIAGLLLFAGASVFIFFTHNVSLFLVLRMVMALGVCAATVSWQALVIEKYPSSETSKIFATIMPLVALSPAIAPLIGVYILEHAGWRYIFLTLSFLAVVLVAYTFGIIEKKEAVSPETGVSSIRNLSYFSFLKDKNYTGHVLIYAFCSAGFFAWLTGAPFFLKEMGYDENEIGWSFVPQTLTFMLGGYGLRFLSGRTDTVRFFPYLLTGYAVCMLLILLMTLFFKPNLLTLLIPFSAMAFCNGASYPIAVNNALKPFKENAGKASALQNTIQLGICFIASSFVSLFSADALLATSVVMAATVVFVGLGWSLTKQHGK